LPRELPPVTRPISWDDLEKTPAPAAPDHQYAYGPAPQQIIDVRLPKDAGQRRPIAFLLHGGCWLNRFDRLYFAHLADALRARGWITVNVEYRRLGDAGGDWPGPLRDVQSAFAYVAHEAPAWGGDPTRIVVSGHSAGGHLALLLAAQEPRVGAVLGLAAITDLRAYREEKHSCGASARKLVADADIAAADPLSVATAPRRVILWSGTEDKIVPPRYGERYVTRWPRTQHVVWPGAGHFDLVSPASPLWPTLLAHFDSLR
jgi:acetyl esterase/lipase